MPNQIDSKVKEQRSNKLIELSNKNQKKQNEEYIGKEIEVLFEEKDNQYIKGHTSNYILVYANSSHSAIENTIRKVKITNIIGENLFGEIIY